MAYKKGEVQVGAEGAYLRGEIYLPHSCDEWVIGTKEDAEQLIADLQELLKEPT